jgi:hypothetical protein
MTNGQDIGVWSGGKFIVRRSLLLPDTGEFGGQTIEAFEVPGCSVAPRGWVTVGGSSARADSPE